MGKIVAICTSVAKGTPKVSVGAGKLLENFGIENDAHAGNWHRQVSLLSLEKITDFKKSGIDIDFGAFGENLVIEGIDFSKMAIGTRLKVGDALLEVTQIGKVCHDRCRIYQTVGDCIMPREGIFTKVLKPGSIEVGTEINYI